MVHFQSVVRCKVTLVHFQQHRDQKSDERQVMVFSYNSNIRKQCYKGLYLPHELNRQLNLRSSCKNSVLDVGRCDVCPDLDVAQR